MNEQQEIFTSGTFGDPASIQHYDTLFGAPPIDPQDPFRNETEFHDYQPDYGEIVPQIRIPGCWIPLRPNRMEKKRIRKYCSIAGGGMLAHFVLSNLLAVLLLSLLYAVIGAVDASRVPELPLLYDVMLTDYVNNSSAFIAMTLLIYLICNAGIALVGLRISKIPLRSLFRTQQLHTSQVLSYICIAIALQLICGWIAMLITNLLEGAGITAYEADFSTDESVRSIVLMAIYTCIIAPVTEELFYRGFIMKNLSRVSQRFGILASAVLFGLAHQNIAQFVLAFVVGTFMGYLTVKHNSLVPAILAHIAVNTTSEILTLLESQDNELIIGLAGMVYLAVVILGIVLFIRMLILERLPYTVPRQAERGARVALTSIPLLLGAGCNLVMMIVLIVESTQGQR